jgi:hypothetical protein
MSHRIQHVVHRRRWIVVLGLGVVLALGAGGIALAVIPDAGTRVIHGCYNTTSGALRVIDPGKGQSCAAGEASLDWNQRGLNWRGNWSSTASYNIGDAVLSNGYVYSAKVANTNSKPPSANWTVFASQGYANVFSKGVATDSSFPIIVGANLVTVATTSNLPAGNYTVQAQAVVFMDNGAQSMTCDLVDSHNNFATGTAETSGPPDSSTTGTVQTLSLTDAFFNEPAGTKILLQCAKGDGADPNTSEVSSAALTATATDHLVFNGTTINSP